MSEFSGGRHSASLRFENELDARSASKKDDAEAEMLASAESISGVDTKSLDREIVQEGHVSTSKCGSKQGESSL